ncbi:MAG: hypothetical protein HY270_05535 [Deltaproteobacteria bacterium]|nr:hypothetical protein [Deltaproteobacteria bacterium]
MFIVLAAAAVGVWLLYTYMFIPPSPEARQAADAEAQKRDQIALARDALSLKLQEGDKLLRRIDTLKDEATLWNKDIETLMTNERGRALTSDRRFIETCSAAYAKERPPLADVDATRQRIADLLQPLRVTLKDAKSSYTLDPQIANAIDATKRWTEDGLTAYHDARVTIQGQLAEAERAGGKPTSETLRAAIEQLEQHVALEKKEAERKETQVQDDRQRALQATISQQEAFAEATRSTQAAEVRELERMASDVNVQRRYLPFLANGMWTGEDSRNNWSTPEKWKVPGPVSYNRIQEAGVLSDPNVFIEFVIGENSKAYPNDRPKWPRPRTREEVNQYAEKWRLFVKLAPIWLQQGRLQP